MIRHSMKTTLIILFTLDINEKTGIFIMTEMNLTYQLKMV